MEFHNQAFGSEYGNWGFQAMSCQCYANPPHYQEMTPLDKAMKELQACYHETIEEIKALCPPQPRKSPLEEAIERLQEETFEFGTWIRKMGQEQASSLKNMENNIEEIRTTLDQRDQGDLQNKLEINLSMQVDEFLKDSKEGEFLTLEEFDETWFDDDDQDDMSWSQNFISSEEHKVVTTLHEDCPLMETETQLFKPSVEFSRAQEAYTSPQPSIEAKSIPKEDEPSMIVPIEVQPKVSKRVQFTKFIQDEPHSMHGVKSLKEIQACVQWPLPKLGQYYEDDITYIYDPG